MKKKDGSSLIFTVIILFSILTMVITLSGVTILETKMNQKTKSSIGAFYNSEAGVEWALNQIAKSSTAAAISTVFPNIDAVSGKVACPDFGDGSPCELYFLDSEGTIINNANKTVASAVSEIKAVRSTGTSKSGDVTQRAIEAAVGAEVTRPSGWVCELKDNEYSSVTPVIAYCTFPKKLIAGGCAISDDSATITQNRPAINGWACLARSPTGTPTVHAWAWCCE